MLASARPWLLLAGLLARAEGAPPPLDALQLLQSEVRLAERIPVATLAASDAAAEDAGAAVELAGSAGEGEWPKDWKHMRWARPTTTTRLTTTITTTTEDPKVVEARQREMLFGKKTKPLRLPKERWNDGGFSRHEVPYRDEQRQHKSATAQAAGDGMNVSMTPTASTTPFISTPSYAGPHSSTEVVGFSYPEDRRILAFFAVGAHARPMEVVKRNVRHLKAFAGASEKVTFDIYLAHYDSSSDLWKQQDRSFYDRNVLYSADRLGLKFPLAKQLLLHPDPGSEPVVNLSSYDWIWCLDEDADITQIDMRYLLEDLYDTQSLIVSPSIVMEGSDTLARRGHHRPKPSGRVGGDIASLRRETSHCLAGSDDCVLQYPNSNCRFRHTNFVEISFPLIRTNIFRDIFSWCGLCMHKRSTWGLDHVWCSVAAELAQIEDASFNESAACAILDRATVLHRDLRTLSKWDEGRDHRLLDQRDLLEVKLNLPDHWVENETIHGCFH